MNKYYIKSTEVSLENNVIELTSEKLLEVFKQLIEGACEIVYVDNSDFGFPLLFSELEKRSRIYKSNIGEIEKNIAKNLKEHFESEKSKSILEFFEDEN